MGTCVTLRPLADRHVTRRRFRAKEALLRPAAILGALAVLIACSVPAGAEVLLGLTGGFVIPGDQDLKFEERSPSNVPLTLVDTSDVDESLGPIVGAAVTLWGDEGLVRHLALQWEAIYWHIDAKAAPASSAPGFTIGQDRAAIFLSVLGRLPIFPSFGRFASRAGTDSFAYLGVGVGPVYTAVNHGDEGWDVGSQLLGGVAIPLTAQLQLRIESRYLLTSDADRAIPPPPGG
jgi:hypothetical protein